MFKRAPAGWWWCAVVCYEAPELIVILVRRQIEVEVRSLLQEDGRSLVPHRTGSGTSTGQILVLPLPIEEY